MLYPVFVLISTSYCTVFRTEYMNFCDSERYSVISIWSLKGWIQGITIKYIGTELFQWHYAARNLFPVLPVLTKLFSMLALTAVVFCTLHWGENSFSGLVCMKVSMSRAHFLWWYTWPNSFLQSSLEPLFTTTSESYGGSFTGYTRTSSRRPLRTSSTNHSIPPRVLTLYHSSMLPRNSSRRSCSVELKPLWRWPSHLGRSSLYSFP